MKPGTVFLHAQWLDESNQPLRCVVTAIRRGYIYWKRIDSDKGAKDCFDNTPEEIARRVKEVC